MKEKIIKEKTKKYFAYNSLADVLYSDHIENKLGTGDMLPTEQELVDRYNVSRTTVRRCIQQLAEDGIVYTIQGSGSFIKGKKEECQRSKLQGFHERAKSIGAIPKTEVLEFNIEKASKEIAEILRLSEGDLVYRYKRLRYLDDVPNQVEVGYLPVALFPDLSMSILEGSKYHYIKEIKKMVIKKNRLIIEITVLDLDTAELFEIKPNTSVLCIKEIGFLDNSTIFEYTEITMNSSKYDLNFDIEDSSV